MERPTKGAPVDARALNSTDVPQRRFLGLFRLSTIHLRGLRIRSCGSDRQELAQEKELMERQGALFKKKEKTSD
jgi:hypothetical protein